MSLRAAVARVLGAPLELADDGGVADAIVILGSPLAARPRADDPVTGALTDVLAERVLAGWGLYRAGAAPLVCVTGGPSRASTEADAMADALRTLGVPADALRIEREARSTAENATRTAALLAPEGVRRVWLVTQPFHLRRARYLFRRAGLDAWAFRVAGGLQDRHPDRALGWVLREYAAWARALTRSIVDL